MVFFRRLVWILIDWIIIWSVYTVVVLARTLGTWDYQTSLPFIGAALVVNSTILYLLGGYKRLWLQSSGNDISLLLAATFLAATILTPIDLLPNKRFLPISVIWMGQFLALVAFIAVRYRWRLIVGLQWRWKAVWQRKFPKLGTRVLIIGAGKSGQELAMRLHQPLEGKVPFNVVGFADDAQQKQGMLVADRPVLGYTSDIPKLVEKYQIEMVVIASHPITTPELRRILDYCHASDAQIKLVPDVYELIEERRIPAVLRDVRIEDIIGRPTAQISPNVDISPVLRRKIMVTGAAGSIGSELCRQLVHYDVSEMILLDNNESGLFDLIVELESQRPTVKLSAALCDVADIQDVEAIFRHYQPQVVFHAAAYKHVPMLENHPYQAVRVNIGGTYNTARAAQNNHAERFILVSSDKAVQPSSIMGATKTICEYLIRAMGGTQNHTLMTAVRLGNVLGSRGSVVTVFERQIDRGGPVQVTDARMTRYFMSISEAARLTIQAACITQGNDLFLLEMGESIPILELAERMIRLRGLRPYKDIPIEFVGIRPGEKLHEQLTDTNETRTPTPYPGIFTIHVPSEHNGDAQMRLDKYTHLLNGCLKEEPATLAQLVVSLAQHEAAPSN